MVAACMSGHAEVVMYLFDHGDDVNRKMEAGLTRLFFSFLRNQLDIADFLFRNRAKVDVAAEKERTVHYVAEKESTEPLHYACRVGQADAARILLEHGAQVEARSVYDETPLTCAAEPGHLSTMMVLVEIWRGSDGWVLSLAAQGGDVAAVRWLLEYAKTDRDFTEAPMMSAFESGNPDVVEFLLDSGLDGDWDENPLEEAGRNFRVGIIELILGRPLESVVKGLNCFDATLAEGRRHVYASYIYLV
ncbi:ankyrin repeat-containing domain protein [Zopfochytrium polystomum]|nr:ankyrin repeat-containing domain protein [Zopfochytrium polystomum]